MADTGVIQQEDGVLKEYKESHKVGGVRLGYPERIVRRQLPQGSQALGRRGCVPVKAGDFTEKPDGNGTLTFE